MGSITKVAGAWPVQHALLQHDEVQHTITQQRQPVIVALACSTQAKDLPARVLVRHASGLTSFEICPWAAEFQGTSSG